MAAILVVRASMPRDAVIHMWRIYLPNKIEKAIMIANFDKYFMKKNIQLVCIFCPGLKANGWVITISNDFHKNREGF